MRMAGIAAAKIFGVFLMAVAVWVWVSYEYPNVSTFTLGAPFAPGMFGQVINWVIVCILGASGWFLFTLGRKNKSVDASK
jgi:hypothetical protein